MHVKILDERVVARAKARGLDVLVYAPHFTRLPDIRERARRFSDDDLLIVPAREIFTGSWRDRRHILALGLDDPIPDFITLDGALTELRRQGAAVLVPHPEFMNVSLGRDEIAANAADVDDVETYNAKCLPYQNRRAQAVARETEFDGFGSSYAHLRRTVGEAWTEFDEPIPSADALVELLKRGAPRRVKHRAGIGHRLTGLAEFCHLGYENSWGKIDRLFLSGMEPTHPGHVVYADRFEDVREY